jgi:hypothetical protein
LNRFKEQIDPGENYCVQRLKLSKLSIKQGEPIDSFVTRAKELALECKFKATELDDRIIELIIASTPIAKYQKELLTKPDTYKLEDAIKLGRIYEVSAHSLQTIQNMNESEGKILGVRSRSSQDQTCRKCGLVHYTGKKCPARDSECHECHKVGHWAKYCPSKQRKNCGRSKSRGRNAKYRDKSEKKEKNVNAVNTSCDVDAMNNQIETFMFSQVSSNQPQPRDEAYTMISVKFNCIPGQHKLKVKVDTGAQRNTLPARLFQEMFPNREYPETNAGSYMHIIVQKFSIMGQLTLCADMKDRNGKIHHFSLSMLVGQQF